MLPERVPEWPDEFKTDDPAWKDSATFRCHPPRHSICAESHIILLSSVGKLYGSRKQFASLTITLSDSGEIVFN